jgi:predicted NAD/FAD-binding protein
MQKTANPASRPLAIAVIGTGISGMAAAWLLSKRHNITVYEKNDRIGGHSNTVTVEQGPARIPVDTGFIVYNERNYPNLTALFDHLDVATEHSSMSFSASLDGGDFEYSGTGLGGLFAQPRNLLRPRMWSMLRDLRRFYREATGHTTGTDTGMTLGDYLRLNNYGDSFINDHLLPMGAAIWSTPARDMLDYPLFSFIRFCDNHGLLQLKDRPAWRTVTGGSREYVDRLTASFSDRILLNTGVTSIQRKPDGVIIEDRQGDIRWFDHVVIAAHANEALNMLADSEKAERQLLGAIRYERNHAILHSDKRLMPRTHKAWASWNFMGNDAKINDKVSVTYWMNRLQKLATDADLFVTLNPLNKPAENTIHRSFQYDHPVFNRQAIRAQRMLWNLQGVRRTWFCGAYFGHGFHEDGLQAGLAVAEQLGGLQRPWNVQEKNGRIHCYPAAATITGNRVAA